MRNKFSAFFLTSALVLVSIVLPAQADQWNKETRITVNEPLEVPGAVLSPGTYLFKLADNPSDRNIVQIYSEDASGRQKLVTTILAISAYTLEVPDKPMIKLEERPSGGPEAIHSWFYPGENTGWQFVYPKSERLQVAATQTPVQAPAPVPVVAPELKAPPVEAVVAESVVAVPEEQQSGISDEASQPIPDTPEDSGSTDRSLPETAGHSNYEFMAGVTFFGLGLLTVLAGLRRGVA
jgi:hypothetical protein